MDQEQQEPTFEESLKEVMKILPPVIKNYVVNEKYTPVAQNLMRQYKLRIDQGGVLEREILLLLMGVENPDEFISALTTDASLDKVTVDSIVRDVNNQIFIPLRAEEMRASAQKPPSPPPSPPRPNIPDSGSHFHLQNKIPLPQEPMRPRPVMPQAPKPFDPGHMLEDHEEPHIDLKGTPPMPVRTAPPPPNLPGQMPPKPMPRPAGPTSPASSPAAPKPAGLKFSPPTLPSTKPVKYDVDPYREPLDDHESA